MHYLAKNSFIRVISGQNIPNIDVSRSYLNADLKEFYGNEKEDDIEYNLELLCNPIMISAYVDANLAINVGPEGHIQIY